MLVDAECTTDGAIRHHIARAQAEAALYAAEAELGHVRIYRTDAEVADVVQMQKGILWRGWCLLKPGGVLVYCTCSFLPKQNEDVVRYLLDKSVDAQVEPVEGADQLPATPSSLVPGALYFRPAETGGNGLFVVRIRKAAQ